MNQAQNKLPRISPVATVDVEAGAEAKHIALLADAADRLEELEAMRLTLQPTRKVSK